MAKNYTKCEQEQKYGGLALIHPMQMSRTRIRIVPTRTVRTRTAQIVRTVLHLHRRIVERTKIPTIKNSSNKNGYDSTDRY